MAPSRKGPPDFASELDRVLQGRSKEDRKILFVGLLNRHLPKGQRAVLVGGALVEFLCVGQYVTGDVDLVGQRADVRRLLLSSGFEESGRYFVREDLGLVVEVPDSHLRPSETVVEFEFEGYRIPSVSIEDSIVDRLLAAKYWRSPTEREQAMLVFRAQRDNVDVRALREKAKANLVEDFVEQLLKDVNEVTRRPRKS